MLKLKMTQPSQSEWGFPCILVRKPPEKSKLQPSASKICGGQSSPLQCDTRGWLWMLSAKEKYVQNVTWSVDTGKIPLDSQIDTKLHSVYT